MEKNRKFTILYVDDEESNLHIFKNTFRRDYYILTAKSAKEGLEMLQSNNVDLILTDQRMPEMDGVTFLKETIERYPKLNRILITGYTDFNALANAVNDAKIFQYIQKPWAESQLRKVIEKALEIYQLREENETLTAELISKNQQLEKLNQELLELDKIKSDFLSLISHEIRTPLNGIVGVVDLIKINLSEEELKSIESLLEILETSVGRLEKFLLTAERITQFKAGIYKISNEPIDIEKLITKVIENVKGQLQNKNIRLNINNEFKGSFIADRVLLLFSLVEIINNSCEFSPENSTIDVKISASDNFLIFEFVDNGPGFSKKFLEHPFSPFTGEQRADKSKGLSLSLIKYIAENHGGNIEISNLSPHGAYVKLFIKLVMA
ncbi:MAG TPA: hybrid sensor histidine kinase/response regulator [Salinivirgaceae bacterium]|nr:hybrid sensor histidine kinase/response regulator [Salinivirgaceae bacterium]